MKYINKTIKLWSPVFAWAALIFTLSSISTLPTAQKIWWDFILKKSAHVFEYAVLYFLILRALQKRTPKTYLIAFIFSLLYALSDEYHQSFTPGRYPKLIDVGFDTLGMGLSYLKIKRLI